MVYLVGPGVDPAFDAFRVFEALLLEELDGFQGPNAALAMDVEGLVRIQFGKALGERVQRDQGHAVHMRDLILRIGFRCIRKRKNLA